MNELRNGERVGTVYKVTEINPLGYGNPEAKISYKKKIESGEFRSEIVDRGAEIILGGSCMTDVNDKDDGCIDGRLTAYVLLPFYGEFKDLKTNAAKHNRYKVAGGGYITSLVMKLALDPEVETLDEDLRGVAHHLTMQGIYCGTHTGEHVINGKTVDCGANDKFEEILLRGSTLRNDIEGTISYVTKEFDLGVCFGKDVVDLAEAGLSITLSHRDYFAGSNGKARFDTIMDAISEAQDTSQEERAVSVSKHLSGEHNEAFIVINTVAGKTFSQPELQRKLVDAFPDMPPDKLPQAFVVDVPRIVELAEAMAKGRKNEEEAKMIALYAGLAFQFAAAAELTDGTLRRFIVQ